MFETPSLSGLITALIIVVLLGGGILSFLTSSEATSKASSPITSERTRIIQGCQYLEIEEWVYKHGEWHVMYGITHKGNCPNSIHKCCNK